MIPQNEAISSSSSSLASWRCETDQFRYHAQEETRVARTVFVALRSCGGSVPSSFPPSKSMSTNTNFGFGEEREKREERRHTSILAVNTTAKRAKQMLRSGVNSVVKLEWGEKDKEIGCMDSRKPISVDRRTVDRTTTNSTSGLDVAPPKQYLDEQAFSVEFTAATMRRI